MAARGVVSERMVRRLFWFCRFAETLRNTTRCGIEAVLLELDMAMQTLSGEVGDMCDEGDDDTIAAQIAAHTLGLAGLAIQGMDLSWRRSSPAIGRPFLLTSCISVLTKTMARTRA